MINPEKLNRLLGFDIGDPDLYKEAFTHRSLGKRNYERLEFLGDAVLQLVISDLLYKAHTPVDEGALSRMRATLVRGESLASIARDKGLGDWLQLGTSELRSGVFDRDSVLADVVESLIGAIYLDQGMPQAQAYIERLFAEKLSLISVDVQDLKDPKSRLQELLQARGQSLPDYTLLKTEGMPHERQFTVECRIIGTDQAATATETSRRRAEQQAAEAVLQLVESSPR